MVYSRVEFWGWRWGKGKMSCMRRCLWRWCEGDKLLFAGVNVFFFLFSLWLGLVRVFEFF